MRNFISLILVLLMIPGMLVFATGNSETEVATEGIELSAPGVYPIVEETYTMRALAVPHATVEDLKTNFATFWWEEQTNVHVEFDIALGGDAAQKVNLILSSGDNLPDVILNANLTPSQQFLYGSQGILLPLNNLVAEHSPNINKLWTEIDPYVKQQLTAPDGNVYGMSIRPLAYHSTLSQKLWINKKWLDNLGLDMPETTKEFYDVLVAFRDLDANGNGDSSDEVPYSGAINSWRGKMGAFVMNSFIYDDGFGDGNNSNRLLVDQGNIYPAYTQPEWREGLRYLNRLKEEGLLDPEGFVQDQNALKTLNNGGVDGPARVGAAQGGHLGSFSDGGGTMHKQYRALAPLRGPAGNQTAGYYPKNQRGSMFDITKDAENPAIAIKWVDLAFTDTGRMVAEFGEEGIDWRFVKESDGLPSVTGEPALWEQLTPIGSSQNHTWHRLLPNYFPGNYFDRQVASSDDPFSTESRLYVETAEKYEGYQPDEVLGPLFVDVDLAQEYGQLRNDINTYVDQSFARFVTGDLDIETDWDNYLEQFNRIGIDRYLEIVQKTYDRQYK